MEKKIDNDWYLAHLIMQLSIEGLKDIEIHKNLILLLATSDDHAYEKAIVLGKKEETSYTNSKEQEVKIKFLGLAELEQLMSNEIYDGIELTFNRYKNPKVKDIKKMLLPKESLEVFASKNFSKKSKPDFGAKYIREIVKNKK